MVCIFGGVERRGIFLASCFCLRRTWIFIMLWYLTENGFELRSCEPSCEPAPAHSSGLNQELLHFFGSFIIFSKCYHFRYLQFRAAFPRGMFTLSAVGWLKFPVTIAFSSWQPPTIHWLQFLGPWTCLFLQLMLSPGTTEDELSTLVSFIFMLIIFSIALGKEALQLCLQTQ